MESDKPNQFREKTIYRTQKSPFDDDFARNSSGNFLNRPKMSRTGSAHQLNRSGSAITQQNLRNSKFNQSQENINWTDLGEKIEDWFGYAKTPDQQVVYRFLSTLNDDEYSSVMSDRAQSCVSASQQVDKTQSLEDILTNLKKYRQRFNRAGSKTARPARVQSGLPNLNKPAKDLNGMFESSTWRVMRHLKSADIRNKYPLPKANPDYHFRNATVFHTAGRPPKSTFLLHPDWV